jgi:thiosulfate/3-mercaptopyruvate sulfurtransferase
MLLWSCVILLLPVSALATNVPGPLVETDWLAKNLQHVTVLYVSPTPDLYTGQPVYAKDKKTGKPVLVKVGGHIPGAVYVDYKKVRVDRLVNGVKVEMIIPLKADFEKFVRDLGVNHDSAVVIVSDGMNNLDMTMATRLYWQLKYYGQDNMAILDGGLAQWIADGHAVSSDNVQPKAGDWKPTAERKELLADSEAVAMAMKKKSVQLMDNRPVSQYLGTAKQPYVYAMGHIPGAKSFPNELMNKAGAPAKFLPVSELKQLVGAMGLKTDKSTITYCNSGHLASGGWFIMHELLGNKSVKLYDGSMNEWTLEKRPVTAFKME